MRKAFNILLIFVFFVVLIGANIYTLLFQRAIADTLSFQYDGVVICIDAGHGGKDNGASSYGEVEDDINLAIALKLKKYLELASIEVLLTRDGDYDLSSPSALNHKRDDLQKRLEIIDDSLLFVSIHINKYPDSNVHGAQVFYRSQDDMSKTFAAIMQEYFNNELNQDKKIKIGNFYLLNNSNIPGVLVECGFISNYEEMKKLLDEKYQEKIAITIYESIIAFLKEKYAII